MLRDSHSYESQIIDAVRSVNRALGGTYGKSSAIGKTEFNQYEVQLIDAIRGIARTLSGNGLSLAGGGDLSGFVTQKEFQSLSARVTKLEAESFFRLVDGNVTLKTEYNNLWVPGWLAAGGVGTGGGGGGGSSYLKELLDIYHDASGILRANGDPVSNGDVLVYDSTTDPLNPRWAAAASSGGVTVTNYGDSTTGRIATVNGVDIYNGVKWGSAGTNPNTFTLSINGTAKTVCLDGYGGGGTDLATVWNSLTNAVTDEYANTKISLSHIPNITTGMVTDLETWIAAKGYLTSYTETDPTVPAWAKESTKPSYAFSEITGKPTTLSGYGITDAAFGTPGSDNVPITLGSTTISVLTAHQDLTPLTNRIAAVEDWFEIVQVGSVYALHAKQGRAIYSDSWIAAGGVGSGGSGSATALGDLSDVSINLSTIANGQALVYRNGMWVNDTVSYTLPIASSSTLGGIKVGDGLAINGSGVLSGKRFLTDLEDCSDISTTYQYDGCVLTYQNNGMKFVLTPKDSGGVTSIKMNGDTYSPSSAGVVNLGTVITSLSGYATQSWVQQQGYLTSFTETDPTVPSWAKQSSLQFSALPDLYIGKTEVQSSAQNQALEGILSVKLTSSASLFEWESSTGAWRFHGNLYADGWVAAGGIGSTSPTVANLRELSDVYHSSSSVLRSNGTAVQAGDVLTYYSSSRGWVAAPASSASGTVTGVVMNGSTYSPSSAGLVDLGTVLTSFTETDPTVPSWAKASSKPSYAFSELTSHPTTLSGYGITDAKIQNGTITLGSNTITPLTSFTETDPTVPSWAKASTKPSYSLSEITGTDDLRAIEALVGTGLLKRTGTTTWTLDSTNYLSSHQTIYKLTLNAGSFTAGSFTANSAAKTFNIPTTLDHISDGTNRKLSDYVTLSTTQTITGAKTFTTNAVTIGSTSSLSVHENSHIDIGPLRIVYDPTNKALHITKASSGDTNNYGIYADGFVAAGGLNS